MTNYQITNLNRCEDCGKEAVIKFRIPDDAFCIMDVDVHVCLHYHLTTLDAVKENLKCMRCPGFDPKENQ